MTKSCVRAFTLVLAIAAMGTVTIVKGQGAQGTKEAPLFTAQQAAQGRTLYAAHCVACHGDKLQGGAAGPLAGAAFAAAWGGGFGRWATSQLTVDDLDYIVRTTMPQQAPGSLSGDEYSALVAFLLQQNGYKAGSTPLRAGSPQLKEARLHFGMAPGLAIAAPARVTGGASAVPKGGGPTQQELNNAASSTSNWLYTTHDYSGSRYVALDQINQANAGQLQPACVFQVGGTSTFETNPIVYQGTMYVTTSNDTVALDATNCRPKWRYSWVPRGREMWPLNRGVAIEDGYVVRGTPNGYLLALNAKTGALVWAVKAADAGQGQTFDMAPLVYDHLVVIGVAGSENGVSGWVGAFRLSDGSTVWKFHTVPGATLAGSKSWGNPEGIKLGGGAVWAPLTLDPATGRLFVPVANPAPDLAAKLRPGSNLYRSSVVALNIHTGQLLWYKQMVPNDFHDWDLTQVGPLFQGKVDGHEEPLMATAGKDGFLKTIDRENHKVIYSTPVTTIKNAKVPLTAKGVTACPGSLGGVEWSGPALDRQTNTLFVNAVDWCADFTPAKSVRYIPGFLYMGGSATMAMESQGWLTAIDASTGAVRWKYHSTRPMVAAVTATKGGVVFTGDLTGDFLVLNANDGKVLYRFNTGGAIGGGVVTYDEGGRQYAAVMSGNPSPFWVSDIAGAPTVFLFALPTRK